MISIIKRIVKYILGWTKYYLRVFTIFNGINSPSYVVEKVPVKSFPAKVVDYLYLFFILHIFPKNYHLFRFDVKARGEFKQYMGEPDSPILKQRLYDKLWPERYYYLVHDKYLFDCYCRCHNLPVPRIFGLYPDGLIEPEKDGKLIDIMDAHGLDRVVLKPVTGLMGQKIYFIMRNDAQTFQVKKIPPGHLTLTDSYEEYQFIIQEAIKQHPVMDKINPHCVNSIRIISILNIDGTVKLLAAMLRTSATESQVDNFSQGGIVIGIDMETGRLRDEGFLPQKFGTITMHHPVTKTIFKDFQIPYWEDLKKIVIKAQKAFHHLKSIGWDIAITPEGPVIIEGNQEWGTAGIQAANGGLLTPPNRLLFKNYGLRF